MMMSPRAWLRMAGTTRFERACAAKAWVPITRATSSAVVSATARPRLAMPALFTRIDTGPSSASTWVTMASQASGSATEPATAIARTPVARSASSAS